MGRYVTLRKETIAYKAVIRQEERQGKTSGIHFVVGGLVHNILRPSDLLFLGVRKDGSF